MTLYQAEKKLSKIAGNNYFTVRHEKTYSFGHLYKQEFYLYLEKFGMFISNVSFNHAFKLLEEEIRKEIK